MCHILYSRRFQLEIESCLYEKSVICMFIHRVLLFTFAFRNITVLVPKTVKKNYAVTVLVTVIVAETNT